MKNANLLITSLMVFLVSITAFGVEKDEAIFEARFAFQDGHYQECVRFYEEAIKQGADDADVYYDCALCLARIGNKDKAFEYLEKAIENGFVNIDDLKNNKSLFSLHNDKRWLVVVSKGDKYLSEYFDTVNVWVYRMYRSDQMDREKYKSEGNWKSVALKDSMRRDRIRNIVTNKQLKASVDYYNAAMIMHHGTDSTDYKLANELAAKAVELDSSNLDARWLYAASYDRYLLITGKPQIYGTQYNYNNGAWTLEPFDKKAVTDKQRKLWGVSTIAQTQRKVDRLNSR